MRANELRQQITIQVRSNKEDSLGQELLSWTTFANIWAKIEQLSGRELMTANAERAENIAKLRLDIDQISLKKCVSFMET